MLAFSSFASMDDTRQFQIILTRKYFLLHVLMYAITAAGFYISIRHTLTVTVFLYINNAYVNCYRFLYQ